jgi:hypothetical protein
MLIFEKYQIPYPKQIKMLILMNEYGELTFSTQKIYKNRVSFNCAMRFLLECNAIQKRVEKRHFCYVLTADGRIFINGLKK